MTRARHAGRRRLTRRARLARTAVVSAAAAFAYALAFASGNGTAAVADAEANAAPSFNTVGTLTPTASEAAATRIVVGFGDSVPSGAACNCTNFVAGYAQRLPGRTAVADYAESGTTSSDALDRLADPAVVASVKRAGTVLIMTGANDFVDAFGNVSAGADPGQEYGSIAKLVRSNVASEVTQIHQLNPAAHVVVLDYWGVMEDGQVAAQNYDADEQKAAAEATDYVNDALAYAANSTGATFISTLKAFKGVDGKSDPTPLLAADGDHPNAAGHRAIADAIAAVLPRG